MWEQITGWLIVAALIAAVFVGRKLAQRKANRIKAEAAAAARAEVRAEFAAMVSQSVVVQGDDRRTLVLRDTAHDGAALDHRAPDDGAARDVRRALYDRHGRDELAPGRPGAVVVPGAGDDGPVGALGPAGLNDDPHALAVLRAEWGDE